MPDITWQDPPKAKRGPQGTDWTEIAASLRSRPGEWALVQTGPSATQAQNIRLGRLGNIRPGEFEATTRKREDGKFDIYARYVGEVSQ